MIVQQDLGYIGAEGKDRTIAAFGQNGNFAIGKSFFEGANGGHQQHGVANTAGADQQQSAGTTGRTIASARAWPKPGQQRANRTVDFFQKH
jgi:hypothetical protein